MNVIAMSQQFQARPSAIAGITDSYEAFCFDEAASYVLHMAQNEDKVPTFKAGNDSNGTGKRGKYATMSEMMAAIKGA